MKLRIENFATLLLTVVILLGGCSGCGQKTDPDTPITPPNQSTPDRTPKLSGVKQIGTKPKPRKKTAKISPKNFVDLEYLATLKGVEYIELAREDKGGIPFPWDPITVSVTSWKSQLERGRALHRDLRSKKITIQEFNEQVLQIHRENGLVISIQLMIELWDGIDESIKRLANAAYIETPDDFDTLLMWVYAGGNFSHRYGKERTVALRRLYERNPDHPWVLHELAKCILGTNPQKALGYAQKSETLDPRYLPLGVEGLCYYQMGDYEKALASFKRSHQYAMSTSQPSYIIKAIGSWVGEAEYVVNSGGKGESGREKFRKAGIPLLGRDLPIRSLR